MTLSRLIPLFLFLVFSANASVMTDALKAELTRTMEHLKKQPNPPYFLSYEVIETESAGATGSFGALVSSSPPTHRRQLGIDLRVGSYRLDNTHPIRGAMFNGFDNYSFYQMPLEDDPDALRAMLWYYTDQKYKRAVEQFISVRTNVKVKAEETDKSGDFSPAKAEVYDEPNPAPLTFDRAQWEEKVRKYTEPFVRYGNIYSVRAAISADRELRWFVSSDGAVIHTADTSYNLRISAFAKASDGMELPRFENFYSSTMEGLPSDAEVLEKVKKMIADLMALKSAPVMEPYVGPAMLSPRATGVIFHEIFGHRIEGQREKREGQSQTFRDRVGQKVLPDFISVYSDPTQKKYGATQLAGYYKFDNEGVKAQKVTVVENGILKNFLMSRLPVDGFPESNGHGRREAGYNVAGRQSNLLVVASKTVTPEALKAQLIEEVKKKGLPYGLYFDDVAGGFTYVGRFAPNFFEVIPVMVYRIYPDGHEELVRGVDLIGTALTAFNKIVAADNRSEAFNGSCGAESGSVPVSAGGPGLLFSEIEVQKKAKSQELSPILPPPFDDRKPGGNQ
ncbi:MAG TPA: TldD/PmbA family protein [Bryobacteraceae bacterium]|jgi:TldD protein|nr:TldD/PmbA family protein [Bryobacteraceae bacterium]